MFLELDKYFTETSVPQANISENIASPSLENCHLIPDDERNGQTRIYWGVFLFVWLSMFW